MTDWFGDIGPSSDDDDEWQPPVDAVSGEPTPLTGSPTIAARTRAHESLVDVNLDEEMQRLEQLVPRDWDEMDADYEWFVRSTTAPDLILFDDSTGHATASTAMGTASTMTGHRRREHDDDDDEDDEDDEFVCDDEESTETQAKDSLFERGGLHGRHALPPIPASEIQFLKEETTVEGLAMLKQMSPDRPVARYESGRVMRSPRKVADLRAEPPLQALQPLRLFSGAGAGAGDSDVAAVAAVAAAVSPPRVGSDGFARPRTPPRRTTVMHVSPTVTALAQLHALLRLPINRWTPMRTPRNVEEEFFALEEKRLRAEERVPFMVSWPLPNVRRRVLTAAERQQLATQTQQAHQLLGQALVLSRYVTSFDMCSDAAALLVQLEVARERAHSAAPHLAGDAALVQAALLPRERIAALVQLAGAATPMSEVSAVMALGEPAFAELVPSLYSCSLSRVQPFDDALIVHGMHRFGGRDRLSWTKIAELAHERLLRYRTSKELMYRVRNRLSTRALGPDSAMTTARAAVLDALTPDEFVALTSFEQEHPDLQLRSRTHESAVHLAQSPLYAQLRALLPHREPLAVPRLFREHLVARARAPRKSFESRARGVPPPPSSVPSADAAAGRKIVPSSRPIDPQTLLAMATRNGAPPDDDEEEFEVEDLCTPPDDEGFEFEDLYDAPLFITATTTTPSLPPRAAKPQPPWTLDEDRAILVDAQRTGLLARALQALKAPGAARALFGDERTSTPGGAEQWHALVRSNAQLAARTPAAVAARFDELVQKMAGGK